MEVVNSLLPTVTVKCCHCHLGQSWWRKIQSLGLGNEYKDKESDIGKWLLMKFGIHFVSSDSIEDNFAEVIMSEDPSDSRCPSYADYLMVNYMTQESKFLLNLLAEPPSDVTRTTNGAESLHSHFKAQFIFVILPYMPTWMLLCKSKMLIISRSGISLKLRCNRKPKGKKIYHRLMDKASK